MTTNNKFTQNDKSHFGSSRSPITGVHSKVSIRHWWCQTIDQKGSVRALFVDFRKAFDRVDHDIIG